MMLHLMMLYLMMLQLIMLRLIVLRLMMLLLMMLRLMLLRFVSTEIRQLDDYIKHYEELSYSTQNLHNKHMRAKKSTGSKSLDLKFKAHSREFHLDLKPSTSSFTESYRSTHNNGTEDPVDLAILY
ncbi:disintegrin and metalloproteinase domain-containing protein 10-like isoform X1 [Crassostrea virginica]